MPQNRRPPGFRAVFFPLCFLERHVRRHWLDGYKVVISEVVRTYGDARIDHLLAG